MATKELFPSVTNEDRGTEMVGLVQYFIAEQNLHIQFPLYAPSKTFKYGELIDLANTQLRCMKCLGCDRP